jgi:hypothetical protein
MRFSTKTLLILFLLFSVCGFAQIKIITRLPEVVSNNTFATTKPDTISHWAKKNTLGIDISQIAFVNWSAGGTSAITGLLKGLIKRDYKDDHQIWANELIFKYGLNQQQGVELRKTDDVFRINSTYGYRKDTLSNWYHSAKFNFNTQFSNGYNYPNTENPISKPFAPAYTFLGIGSEYIYKPEKLNIYLSPLTLKNTTVLDQTLANKGAYGVPKATYDAAGILISNGKKSKTEVGILVTSSFEKEVLTNVTIKNRLSLFTDYRHNFGNIDVDWQFQADFKVNNHIKSNIGFNLIYDEDIELIEIENGVSINRGAKIQLKQVLGIGLEYTF